MNTHSWVQSGDGFRCKNCGEVVVYEIGTECEVEPESKEKSA
jgi:hypothetical protein